MASQQETVGGFPVVRFRHPERIGDIAIVGMAHAQPTAESYDALNAYLRDRHATGGEVHAEGIRDPTHYELGRVDKKTRRRARLFEDELLYHDRIDKLLGLELQKNSLEDFPHPDGEAKNFPVTEREIPWRPHDFSSLDFAQRLPGIFLGAALQDTANSYWWAHRLTSAQQELLAKAFLIDDEELKDEIFDELPPEPYSPAIERIIAKYQPLEDDVMMRQRDAFAVAAIKASALTDPDMPITVTWGQAHLPGIGRGVEALGYEKQEAA